MPGITLLGYRQRWTAISQRHAAASYTYNEWHLCHHTSSNTRELAHRSMQMAAVQGVERSTWSPVVSGCNVACRDVSCGMNSAALGCRGCPGKCRTNLCVNNVDRRVHCILQDRYAFVIELCFVIHYKVILCLLQVLQRVTLIIFQGSSTYQQFLQMTVGLALCFAFFSSLLAITGAVDCLEIVVCEITCYLLRILHVCIGSLLSDVIDTIMLHRPARQPKNAKGWGTWMNMV